MPAMMVNIEPLGIVVQDGGELHAAPKIMWFWASEDGVPERELE